MYRYAVDGTPTGGGEGMAQLVDQDGEEERGDEHDQGGRVVPGLEGHDQGDQPEGRVDPDRETEDWEQQPAVGIGQTRKGLTESVAGSWEPFDYRWLGRVGFDDEARLGHRL